jgi:hypothetical protein
VKLEVAEVAVAAVALERLMDALEHSEVSHELEILQLSLLQPLLLPLEEEKE